MKLIALLMVVGLSVVACNKAEEGHDGHGDKKEDKADDKKADEKEGKGGDAKAGSIGVKECDDYITKLEACMKDIPEAGRPAMEQALKANRDAWTEAAKTPAGKSGLAMGCKAALDGLATTCK